MPCTISGTLAYLDATGTRQVIGGKKVYLRPSRTDFTYLAGGTWEPWPLNPNLTTGYKDCIETTSNSGTGAFSFSVPFSDTEVNLPVGAPVPALLWNIEIPDFGKVYFGPTLDAIVGASKKVDELLQLAAPNTWQVGGATQYAVWAGTERIITVTFTSASQDKAVEWNSLGGADWKYAVGPYCDTDGRIYTCACKPATKAAAGATFRCSDLPQVGKDVSFDLRIWR